MCQPAPVSVSPLHASLTQMSTYHAYGHKVYKHSNTTKDKLGAAFPVELLG